MNVFKSNNSSLAVNSETYSETDFPMGVPRPKWLHSAYHADYWVTTGTRPGSHHTILFNVQMSDGLLLTDPQHFHLLDTVRRMSIGFRTGPYATVTDAFVHTVMTNAIVNWVLWMDLNNIRAFGKLSSADFEAFIERAVFGVGHLLEFPDRIRRLIEKIRESGAPLPTQGRFLDTKGLLKGHMDLGRVRQDRASLYELWKAAQQQGLYLQPRQLALLKQGPVVPSRISQLHLRRILSPWECQWQMRRTLPGDKLTFDPFASGSIGKLSASLGKGSARTETIPIPQAMFLIDRSIRWVLDYSCSILELIKRADGVAQAHPVGPRRRTRVRRLNNILTECNCRKAQDNHGRSS